jgi:hypothetical protein
MLLIIIRFCGFLLFLLYNSNGFVMLFFVDSFKSGLIEFALKSKMKVPEFHSRNEGQSHAPKFRSSVMVDGLVFTTEQTFSHRKVADEEVSRSALEWLINKIIPEGYSLIAKVC